MNRLLVAVAIGGLVSLAATQFLIGWLTRHRIGQPIREDGPEGHQTKAGTPTMGGAAIVAGSAAAYTISDLWGGIYTRTGLIVMATIILAGFVGFLDDWIKVSSERNLGLSSRAKFGGLLAVAVLFPVLMLNLTDVHTELSFTRYDSIGWDLGPWGWGAMCVLTILATSNAVNLTDGLDGLAAGASIFGCAAFTAMAFWMFRHPGVYDVDHALDLAVVAASVLAGTVGFLWFNAAPAQIFMGDTGSLALGTALATLALATNTMLLLPIIGGLFVSVTLSVIIQVGVYKVTGGRRVFRMAPIHHHFELKGWPETRVIIRFWLIAGFLTAIALGIFYADFTSLGLAS